MAATQRKIQTRWENITAKETNMKLFGCLTLGDHEYIEALLGRIPQHSPVVLKQYTLWEQEYDALPSKVKEILGQKFVSYFLKENKDEQIEGICWVLNDQDERLLDAWELEGLWHQKIPVVVHDINDQPHLVLTYNVKNPSGWPIPRLHDRITDNAQVFPIKKEEHLQNVRNFRREFLTGN